MIFKETIFNDEGETVIKEGNFKSKKEVLDLIKKLFPNYRQIVFSLTIYDECEFMFHGVKRKIELIKE